MFYSLIECRSNLNRYWIKRWASRPFLGQWHGFAEALVEETPIEEGLSQFPETGVPTSVQIVQNPVLAHFPEME
jgi:hypothetical protein